MKKIVFSLVFLSALLSAPALAGELTLRGCWVSSVYNLDYPSAPGLSADALAAEADAIVARAQADGINALFLQVRPCADALYPSAVFPWSAYLSGTQGTAPDGAFDPLGYFLGKCHEQGISLHAWINPYRVTRSASDSRDGALALLSGDHPARTLSDSLLYASDGCLYLDPGRPESRALILDGIRELLERYDLDGIHFDDYFYPSCDFDDSATVEACSGGMDAASFRRASVNTLLADAHALCARLRPSAQFGVSPFGIWANASQDPLGSDTVGGSSYFDHYADSRAWVREGLVDYIMPQLYWSIGAEEGEFAALLRWWSALVDDTRVKLYVGLAAYRSMDAPANSVWFGGDELARQLDLLTADKRAAGAVLFRYGALRSVPALEETVAARFVAQRDKYRFPRDAVTVGLSLKDPGDCWLPAGTPVTLRCDAAPGSTVSVRSGGVSAVLNAQADGTFSGTLVPAEPAGDDRARTSALLYTAERDGFVWVRFAAATVSSVRCGEPVALTDVAGAETETGHAVVFDVGAPCGLTLDRAGDALYVTLTPVKTAALFEDGFFSDIRMTCADGVCTYMLGLPGNGASWRCDAEWTEERIRITLRRIDE